MILWPLKQSLGILVFALFGGFATFGPIIAVVGLGVAAAASYVRWDRFSWWIEGGTLVIEQGLFERKRRVIPADRVQSVDLIKPLQHRLFGVVQVRVEAIGGTGTEGLLEAVQPGTAFGIQRALLGDRAPSHPGERPTPAAFPPDTGPAAPTSPGAGGVRGAEPRPVGAPGLESGAQHLDRRGGVGGRPPAKAAPGTLAAAAPSVVGAPRMLAEVAPAQLVVAGLTGARVGVAAVIFGGAAQLFGDAFFGGSFFGGVSIGGFPFGDDVADTVGSVAGRTSALTGLFLIAVGALVIFAISVAATAATYWGFTVMRDGTELRISRGLFEQRLETVPLRRIQSLRIEQNFLRRKLGLASVHADLAGRAGDSSGGSGLLLPIGRLAEAETLIAELLGNDRPVKAILRPAPVRARRRFAFRAIGPAILAAGLTAATASPMNTSLWAIPVVGLLAGMVALPLYLAGWEALGRAEIDGTLVSRTGVMVQRRVHVPVARIQTMTLSESPFQRRRNLADVQIGIARSGGWAGPNLPEVDATQARELVAAATHEAVEASRITSENG